jgi:exonuclease III
VRMQTWPNLGLLPRWALRSLARAGYVDCFRRAHPDSDGFTIPAPVPHARLDYVLADAACARALLDCEVLTSAGAAGASDHLPVLATFDAAMLGR